MGAIAEKGMGRSLPKPNNIITVKPSNEKDFFAWWCTFLKPFLNLTDREIEVLASLLKHRYLLSKTILDPSILDEVTFSDNTRAKVIEDCHLTLAHFYVVMSTLRKNKVIVDNMINPRLIPNIRQDDSGVFQLLVLFKDEARG